MRVPYSWLKDFVQVNLSADELAELLTRSGIEVEEITSLQPEFKDVVVAEVLAVEPHPEADKLFVVQADIGTERCQVVAGIANMEAGDKVPLAKVGARLPGGLKIKRTKLRGVESEGMLCSAEELGLELNVPHGILVLEKSASTGSCLKEHLSLEDPIMVLGLTPNRADCLGLLGVALEVAALTGAAVEKSSLDLPVRAPVSEVPKIHIEDPSLCSRYTGLIMNNIEVRESPLWMQVRLLQAGVRPINTVVDVTNYVMWEWGQPLHAFDYDLISEKKIAARAAQPGEELVTLDNVKRELKPGMLVIADARGPVALAGVMGGLETEITEKTSNVLLEAANFNPVSIRRTGRTLGMYSESQQRFEKGVDINGTEQAITRAALLLEMLGAGQAEGKVVDEYVYQQSRRVIQMRPDRARKIIGLDISQKEMTEIFCRQGFEVSAGKQLHVTVPTRRSDLQEEIDLVEEIARIHGYDKIKTTLPTGKITQGRLTLRQQILKKTKEILLACGLTEVINYSFVSPRDLDKLRLGKEDSLRKTLKIANPLTEEQSIMRTCLAGGLLQTIAYNCNRGEHDLCVFEIGTVYLPGERPLHELPQEKTVLGLAITGSASPLHWSEKEQQEVDFFNLKGIIEALLNRLGADNTAYQGLDYELFQPGQAAAIKADSIEIGRMGAVHPLVLEEYDLAQPVFLAEVNLEFLLQHVRMVPRYSSLPRFPAMLRDLAVIVPEQVSAADVEAVIKEAGGPRVEKAELFDLYRGEQIPAGSRSLAFAITYRDKERTLGEEDAALLHEKIEKALSEKLGGSLRR